MFVLNILVHVLNILILKMLKVAALLQYLAFLHCLSIGSWQSCPASAIQSGRRINVGFLFFICVMGIRETAQGWSDHTAIPRVNPPSPRSASPAGLGQGKDMDSIKDQRQMRTHHLYTLPSVV